MSIANKCISKKKINFLSCRHLRFKTIFAAVIRGCDSRRPLRQGHPLRGRVHQRGGPDLQRPLPQICQTLEPLLRRVGKVDPPHVLQQRDGPHREGGRSGSDLSRFGSKRLQCVTFDSIFSKYYSSKKVIFVMLCLLYRSDPILMVLPLLLFNRSFYIKENNKERFRGKIFL